MSKYNHIKSIPVDSIPKEEIKQAIHEWAEGSKAMEKLLWTCYEKNIKTCGCHAEARPWISFKYQDNLDRIIPLFYETQKVLDSQIVIMVDGGNPFSGPEWDLSSIAVGINSIKEDEIEKYFDNLNTILNKSNDNNHHPMIDLLQFFLDKETGLLLRLRHTKEDKFIFTLEARSAIQERLDYYNEIFINAGLTPIPFNKEVSQYHEWKIESNNSDDIINKLNKISKYIINNYSLEPETKEENIKNFVLLARYKRKELNQEQLEEYLNEYLKKKNK